MKTPLTVNDFLMRAAVVYGDRVGIVDEPNQPAPSLGSLTFRELQALASHQAAALDELGIGPGERVAIVSKNAARLLISFFGVSGYGRILVPINFRLKHAEISYIVEHSQATVLLIDDELHENLPEIPGPVRIVLNGSGDQQLFRERSAPVSWQPDEDATATINYTSGTTARPKGVQLTHRNLWINAALLGLHVRVTDRDVYLHTLPMFHCNGWGMPYILSAMGARQIVLRQVDGTEILRRIEQHGVTLLCGAPAVAGIVLEAARRWQGTVPGRDQVRMVVAGAAPSTRLIQRIEAELGWEFIQIYGLTETSPLLTINHHRAEYDDATPDERAKLLSRAGYPVLGVDLSTDGAHEVLARGNVVMDRYWENREATTKALHDGWFHSGDSGTVGDDGCLAIFDRQKDIVISGGENVSSLEVEDVLCSHPAVAEVAVIGVPHEKWGETVKALVVLGNGDATERDLIDYCRNQLAHFKCPTSVEFRDSLPRTATGKIQKFKLRKPYWEGHEHS